MTKPGLCGLVLVCALLGCSDTAFDDVRELTTAEDQAPQWLAAWGTTRESVDSYALAPRETTARNIVRLTVGGEALRIRLFNLDPAQPITIAAASVGIRQPGTRADIQPDSLRPLSFDGGAPGVVIPPNTASYYSDPVKLAVCSQDDIAVNLYIQGENNPPEFGTSWNESYKLPNRSGDGTGQSSGENFRLIDDTPAQFPPGFPVRCNGCRPYALRDVEVLTKEASGVMLFLGSSSLHGMNTSQNQFLRVTDVLALRMRDEVPMGQRHSIITRAISGDTLGEAMRNRLDIDVWPTPGLQSLVVWVTNDLTDDPADVVIDRYQTLLAEAHSRGVKVFCPTWLPGANSLQASLNGERAKLNDWILSSGACDGVVDWNAQIEAPGGLTMLPQYNSGDFIHSNDAGHAAWAAVTPLQQWLGGQSPGSR
nr:hypothetical protein [Oceanococcus sp. HetDA_MAG_MS8]